MKTDLDLDLALVRHRLDRLLASRRTCAWTAVDSHSYRSLCDRERDLLASCL
jgi:hypothetical protein